MFKGVCIVRPESLQLFFQTAGSEISYRSLCSAENKHDWWEEAHTKTLLTHLFVLFRIT